MAEPLDLDAIRARAEAADAGPWTTGGDGLVWADRLGDPVSGSNEPENAEFIAHARTDVPALLAEIERLRTALGACRTALHHHLDACTDQVAGALLPLDELLVLHDWDELIFGGFICLHCTPDDAAIPEENVYWPCPPLRAAGLTDDAAKDIIVRHRAEVEARAKASRGDAR